MAAFCNTAFDQTVRFRRLREEQRGMTLIEIIVVIVLISLVFGIVASGVFSKGEAAKAQLNEVKMQSLQKALDQYRFQFSTYPGKLEDLITPSAQIKSQGKLFVPLVKEEDLKDVWGAPYLYRTENNNRTYVLSSLGSDSLEGGDGPKQDISKRPG